jgi:hypothetical protein
MFRKLFFMCQTLQNLILLQNKSIKLKELKRLKCLDFVQLQYFNKISFELFDMFDKI